MVRLEQLQTLLDAGNEQEWSAALLALTANCGFDHSLFGILPSRQVAFESAFVAGDYPQAWRAAYDEQKMHQIDPVVTHCLRSNLPIVWRQSTFQGRAQHELYEQASAYGLRSGIGLPAHGSGGQIGLLSIVVSDPRRLARASEPDMIATLSLLRDYALESSLRFLPPPAGAAAEAADVSLTARELECLQWAMQGKSSWEIAQILRRSEATVNFHVANAKKKFKVQTRQQAVIKAIKLGLIEPE